eukprot:2666028-Pyramimonas_sp.AAC.1
MRWRSRAALSAPSTRCISCDRCRGVLARNALAIYGHCSDECGVGTKTYEWLPSKVSDCMRGRRGHINRE